MFPKVNRAERSDIVAAKKEGTLKKAETFAVLVNKTGTELPPRVAIIVSTKVSPLSVARNKVKRMARSAVSPHLATIQKGTVLLFLTNKRTLLATAAEINADVVSVLKQI